MIDQDIRVMILIPVYNAVELIHRTLQSIQNLDYDHEKIYIYCVDFGSTDGTYEELLSYESSRLAVMQLRNSRHERTMIAEAQNTICYQYAGGTFCYELLLEPGDILYPDFLKCNVELRYHNRIYDPAAVWCETDIRDKKGNVIHPVALYDDVCLLRAGENQREFITHGVMQQMLAFDNYISGDRSRLTAYANEGRYWFKAAMDGIEYNYLYNPEVLSCREEKQFPDELEEVLLRWENGILFARGYEAKYKKELDHSITEELEKIVSHYALYRCCRRFEDLAEDDLHKLYQIAAVIYPEIESENNYQEFMCAYEQKDSEKIENIARRLEFVSTKRAVNRDMIKKGE